MKVVFLIGRFSTYIHGQLDADNLFRGRAITGSESSFLHLVRSFAESKHDVTVHGDFVAPSDSCAMLGGARVVQIDEDAILPGDADAYISLNEPDRLAKVPMGAKGLRMVNIQYNDFGHASSEWIQHVDIVASLSPVHKAHLRMMVPENKLTWIPNSIDPSLYSVSSAAREKSAVWCSSPDRGLHRILEIWPEVRRKVPEAKLYVCYRFDPWYERFREAESKTGDRARFIGECLRRLGRSGENGVFLLGGIANTALAGLLGKATVLPYTCDTMTFTEGFSVSIMDACASGVVPVISDVDAIGDIYRGVAHVIPGRPGDSKAAWVDAIVRSMTDEEWRSTVATRAAEFSKSFHRQRVAKLWQLVIEKNASRKGMTHNFSNMPATIEDFVGGSWQEALKKEIGYVNVQKSGYNGRPESLKPVRRALRAAVILGPMSRAIHGYYDVDKLYEEGLMTGTGSNFFNIVWGLAERGHQIDAFCDATRNFINHPRVGGANVYNLESVTIDSTYDAYISINEPDMLRGAPANKLRVCAMWLNDFSFCQPGFDNFVDVYACPSDTHARYLVTASGISPSKIVVMPLSVNAEFFCEYVPRRRNSVAYTSSPDRGLHHVLAMWGDVRKEVPDAELRIYYRFQPWYDAIINDTSEMGSVHRSRAMAIGKYLEMYGRNGENGVKLVGPVPTRTMARELLSTRVFAYTCDPIRFTEGFSVSIMDASMAGCVPIVAAVDALPEIYSGAVHFIEGDPEEKKDEWVKTVVAAMRDDDFASHVRNGAKALALNHTRQKIAGLWEALIDQKTKP